MEIKLNIEKKHFWAIILVIVMLFGVVIVIAAAPWTDDQPFHEPLYTDTISSKSGSGVTVDDDLLVTGDITADQSITLGGVSKDEWPEAGLIYVGSCFVPPGGACACFAGTTIMLLEGNSAGVNGYCEVWNQGNVNVEAHCDGPSAGGSRFACFRPTQ